MHVVDYDPTTRTFYRPQAYRTTKHDRRVQDPFRNPSNATILENPGFHGQNVYAIVMRTLWRFEFALGRHVPWSGSGQQLKVAPHAFVDANAFYSEDDEGLMLGYFGDPKNRVFTCLSHDIVAHETTHALVDGLRTHFTDPSSLDQAAFHEGFADIVAMLSVFSLPHVIEYMLDGVAVGRQHKLIPEQYVRTGDLAYTTMRLAEQMGYRAGRRPRAGAPGVGAAEAVDDVPYGPRVPGRSPARRDHRRGHPAGVAQDTGRRGFSPIASDGSSAAGSATSIARSSSRKAQTSPTTC